MLKVCHFVAVKHLKILLCQIPLANFATKMCSCASLLWTTWITDNFWKHQTFPIPLCLVNKKNHCPDNQQGEKKHKALHKAMHFCLCSIDIVGMDRTSKWKELKAPHTLVVRCMWRAPDGMTTLASVFSFVTLTWSLQCSLAFWNVCIFWDGD